jgi:hypothetical protein
MWDLFQKWGTHDDFNQLESEYLGTPHLYIYYKLQIKLFIQTNPM